MSEYEEIFNKMNENKLSILKDLLVSEEHTLEELKTLVEKSKKFIKIEEKSGKVIISPEFDLTSSEKIALYLVGVYFSKEMGLNGEEQITSRKISDSINVAQTTLSGPLGELVRKKIVEQKDNSYEIKYYEINNFLDSLVEKYANLEINSKKKLGRPKKSKKNNSPKKIITPKKVEKFIKLKENDELFEKRLKEQEIEVSDFDSIYNIDNDQIILLRGFKGTTYAESHVKSILLLLTSYKLLTNEEEINSSLIRKMLQQSGVPNLAALTTTLKGFSTLIIHKRGAIGSTNTSYKLTSLGFREGIILVKDIINHTSNFKIEFKQRIRTEKAKPINIDYEVLQKNISEFSKENDIDEEKLKLTFDFSTDNLRLLKKPKEKIRKIQQIKSLMLLGIVLKNIYHISSFSGKTLLKHSNISYDRLDLLDGNKDYENYFSKKPKTAMELNYAGQIEASKRLKGFLEED
ncbi:MAG: hypothetical protein WC438_05310 [Candidatus Pacearchaeota archaeon]